MKTGYLITKTDGSTMLLFDYARAHGIAGHYGWTVRELSPVLAAAHNAAPSLSSRQDATRTPAALGPGSSGVTAG